MSSKAQPTTQASPHNQTQSHLLNLPPEIKSEIFKMLGIRGRLWLRKPSYCSPHLVSFAPILSTTHSNHDRARLQGRRLENWGFHGFRDSIPRSLTGHLTPRQSVQYRGSAPATPSELVEYTSCEMSALELRQVCQRLKADVDDLLFGTVQLVLLLDKDLERFGTRILNDRNSGPRLTRSALVNRDPATEARVFSFIRSFQHLAFFLTDHWLARGQIDAVLPFLVGNDAVLRSVCLHACRFRSIFTPEDPLKHRSIEEPMDGWDAETLPEALTHEDGPGPGPLAARVEKVDMMDQLTYLPPEGRHCGNAKMAALRNASMRRHSRVAFSGRFALPRPAISDSSQRQKKKQTTNMLSIPMTGFYYR